MKKLFLKWVFSLVIVCLFILGQANKESHPFQPVNMQKFLVENTSGSKTLDLNLLIQENSDTVGIISIAGLLEEVVVSSQDNFDYLYTDFFGNKSTAGNVFLDYHCNLSSQNIIIYGHSSKKQNIYFTELTGYLEKDYANHFPIVCWETSEGVLEYEIFSVFLFDINKSQENDLLQADWMKLYLFENAVLRLKNRSIVTFNIELPKIKQILTLVTCNPKNKNERIVIVAYKKEKQETYVFPAMTDTTL